MPEKYGKEGVPDGGMYGHVEAVVKGRDLFRAWRRVQGDWNESGWQKWERSWEDRWEQTANDLVCTLS